MIAVLTGDIVASTELPGDQQEALMCSLSDDAGRMADWHGASLRFSRQRGDGWQVLLARPALALRSALYLQSGLRSFGKGLATRISIAVGDGDAGPGTDLNSANGPAFVASGRGLDAMQAPGLIQHTAGGSIGAATCLADHIAQDWTPAQARALHPMLAPIPPRHTDVAGDLGITRQAVTQALDAAGYAALLAALGMIEAPADGM